MILRSSGEIIIILLPFAFSKQARKIQAHGKAHFLLMLKKKFSSIIVPQ